MSRTFAANVADHEHGVDVEAGAARRAGYCIARDPACPGPAAVPDDLDSLPGRICSTCVSAVTRSSVDVTEPREVAE